MGDSLDRAAIQAIKDNLKQQKSFETWIELWKVTFVFHQYRKESLRLVRKEAGPESASRIYKLVGPALKGL